MYVWLMQNKYSHLVKRSRWISIPLLRLLTNISPDAALRGSISKCNVPYRMTSVGVLMKMEQRFHKAEQRVPLGVQNQVIIFICYSSEVIIDFSRIRWNSPLFLARLPIITRSLANINISLYHTNAFCIFSLRWQTFGELFNSNQPVKIKMVSS